MKQNTNNFIHQMFNALSWEDEMKSFIKNIDCSDDVIWHRKREYSKIHQELAPLGYYVKKRAKPGCSITFKLNNLEGKADGWIYEDEKIIENIQIAIGFYGKKEADIDKDIMNGKDITNGGWVWDKLEDLYNRIETIIENKDKKQYENIDTLIVGSNNWFANRVSTAESGNQN